MTRKRYPLAPDDPAWARLDKMLALLDAYYAAHPDEAEALKAADDAAMNWPRSAFEEYERRIAALEQEVRELHTRLDAAEGGK